MNKRYKGYYRTMLTDDEKRIFKQYALLEGSVTSVHDRLLRDYIEQERRRASNGSSGNEGLR